MAESSTAAEVHGRLSDFLRDRREEIIAEWEVRVNSLYSLAVRLGIFNMDEYRHAIERMERLGFSRRANKRFMLTHEQCVAIGICMRNRS